MSATPQFIVVLSALTSAVMGVLLLILARKNTQYVNGLIEWTYGLLTLAAAIPLFLTRDLIPDFFSVFVANAMILIGFMLINQGLRSFFNVPPTYSRLVITVFLAAYLLGFIWFTYVQDSLYARAILFSIGGLIVLSDGVWITIRHARQSPGVIILAFALGILVVGRLVRLTFLLHRLQINPSHFSIDSFSQMVSLAAPHFAIPIATIAFVVLAYERLTHRLNALLRQDELTESLNKKAFYEEASREITRAIRYKHPTSFLIARYRQL